MKAKNTITVRSLALGTLFAIVFAMVTVYFTNRKNMIVTGNQIAVLPYMLLILMVVLLNPLCRLIRIVRGFSAVEMMIIFIMGMVSSGLSTFGLTDQLIPIAGSLFNQEWNTSQSEWNRYVVPFVNENYFVSERGVQKAADNYRCALELSLKAKSIYDAALAVQQARIKRAEAEAVLRHLEALPEEDPQKPVKISAARLGVANAEDVVRQVEAAWAVLSSLYSLGPVEEIVKTYPTLIDARDRQVQETKKIREGLEAVAFEKVKWFRRGLPRGLRAYPGIIPMRGDDFHSYGQRLKRAIHGRSALNELKQARAILDKAPDSSLVDHAMADMIGRHLASAIHALTPVAQTAAYEKQQEVFPPKEDEATKQVMELDKRLKRLSEEKRKAARNSVPLLEKQIDTLAGELEQWQTVQRELTSSREKNDWQLAMAKNVGEVVHRMVVIQTEIRQNVAVSEVRNNIREVMQAFPSIEGSLRQFIIGDIPWSHWAKLLFRWSGVILLTYIILMSLNILIFRQWAYNEKLTYPLAELSRSLVVEEGVSPVYRSLLFWMGVALSGSVMGWNVFCKTNIVPGLAPFDFTNSWYPYVVNTAFDGLKYSSCPVFLTMIGLSFLIPKSVSFSMWFFYVVGLIELQLMVWTGHGVDARSFRADWWSQLNFLSAQGQGALLVFSIAVLYKCRRYILCALRPSTVEELEEDEQKELRTASWLFLGGSLGLIFMFSFDMGASLIHTVFFYLVVLVITIGLVRAVTEGGLLSCQCTAGPFHFIRSVFGLDKTWTSASLFAPWMVYYAILFLDIKTFIAPAMANSLKLRDDFKMKRGVFHLAVILAIAVAGVTGIVTALMMCYAGGADTMQGWFYISLPRHVFEIIRSATKDAPPASLSLTLWIGAGAVAMAALLYFRQFVFWLPHPLGLVIFTNWLMGSFWFSIFLGWLANIMVTKFGNKETFQKAKRFFIGVIVGEMTIVILSMVVSMILGMDVTISLNR